LQHQPQITQQQSTQTPTSTHTLSAYVYDGTSGNVGGTVSATIAKLVYEGTPVTTTYTDMGGGWWRLTYSAAATDQNNEYGVQVLTGKTVYVDGVQLEALSYATTYTDGTLERQLSGTLMRVRVVELLKYSHMCNKQYW
jgi:hypothetical protein